MNWFFWALLSAVFAGGTAVLAKAGVEGINSHLATAIRTTVVGVLVWGLVLLIAPGAVRTMGGLSRRTWMFLVLSGVATGVSWLCYFRALQLGPASQVASVDKVSVVFVLVFAALFLGEALTWRTGVGAALIVAGTVVLALK